MPVRYLTVGEVVALHAFICEQMGSPPAPLRNPGGLESAIFRPRAAAYYEGADLIRQCAVLGVGIAESQAFLDGNKRIAFMAMIQFLELNGYTYTGDALALAERLVKVGERPGSLEAATEQLETWLQQHVRPHAAQEDP